MEWGTYETADPQRNMDYTNHPAYTQPNSVPRSQYPVYNDPYLRLSEPELAQLPPSPYEAAPYYYSQSGSPESYSHHPAVQDGAHYAHSAHSPTHSTYIKSEHAGYNSGSGSFTYSPHLGGYPAGADPCTPTSTISDPANDRDSQDPDLGPEHESLDYHYLQPSPTCQSAPPASPRGVSQYLCDNPGCKKVYPRLCDLRKHKKRHLKPFPCRDTTCETLFSTEKDRDRHERSKHRREEHLVCAVCGHRTARKDNMKDHVRRRHGEQDLEKIMDITMRA